MSSFVPAPPGPCPFYHITPGRDCNCILCKHFMTGNSEILDGSYGLPRQGCALPRNDGHGTDLVIARSASDVAIRLSKLQKDPPVLRGVHKTVNGAYRCRFAPFLYANMTYGTVAGSPPLALPLGEPSSARNALHRTVYRSAPLLSVRQIGI